ncbi:SPW repeat protein [Pontibacter oryzae]|uniref:SPW repeat-containing integral membrane domain-containing protein n=1 Tax=Pontibacter oryzae TaxID=2304593 RepID=A0A399RSL4_9BACT|nr:SPW repeat protein [Pontibacter oryzae]RIJ34098.1 hypothetical protein D1627_17205 [Pontibacter oryzae]
MRFIPTRFHGVLDYVVGLIFILAPWLFGFSDVGAATWTIVAAGIIVLVQTVFTDFEVGLVHKIPMRTHLMLDFVLGLILAFSPWIFSFDERVFMPHLVGGVFAILASITTHRVPSHNYTRIHATQRTKH